MYQPHLAPAGNHTEWSGYIIEKRETFGSAARYNRGRHSGIKTHALKTEYVVGVRSGMTLGPDTVGAAFLRRGVPQLFAARPLCGTTQGQRAGKPRGGLHVVTCEKCQRDLQRRYAMGGPEWGA